MAETDVPRRRVMLSLLVVFFSRRGFRIVSVALKRSDMREEFSDRVSPFEINSLLYLSIFCHEGDSNQIVNKILKEIYFSLSLVLEFLIL